MFIYLSAEEPVLGTACRAKPRWILDELKEFQKKKPKKKKKTHAAPVGTARQAPKVKTTFHI